MKEKILKYLTFENKKVFIARLVVLFSVLCLLLAFLLPYASAYGDFKESLKQFGKIVIDEKTGFTGNALVHMTLLEFMKLHIHDTTYGGSGLIVALIIIVMITTISTIAFAFLKKDIPTMVFCIINFVVLLLINFDFSDRGLIGNNYKWGIGYYLYIIFSIVLILGVVAIMIFSKKSNNQN